jgi:hypothetical protein
MGGLSKPQKFILFSLGECRSYCDKRFANKPLQIVMSKAAFIELARAAGFVEKKERALYKNLEALEIKKLISYKDKELVLTKRGWKHYEKLAKQLQPYISVSKLLDSQNVLKYSKKVKAILSRNL